MDEPPPIQGEILRIDDLVTGFSPSNPKEGRPCVVVGRPAGPRLPVRALSTSGGEILIPDGAVDGLEESWAVDEPLTVEVSEALGAESIGPLPERYMQQIKAMLKR